MRTEKITVSEDTARFVGCLKTLQNLNTDILEAIAAIYGERYAEKIMEERFLNITDLLENAIYSFLNHSITNKLAVRGSNEI